MSEQSKGDSIDSCSRSLLLRLQRGAVDGSDPSQVEYWNAQPVRWFQAVDTLKSIGRDFDSNIDTVGFLRAAIKQSRCPAARVAAIRSLGKVGIRCPNDLDELLALLSTPPPYRPDFDQRFLLEVLRTLGKIGPDASLAVPYVFRCRELHGVMDLQSFALKRIVGTRPSDRVIHFVGETIELLPPENAEESLLAMIGWKRLEKLSTATLQRVAASESGYQGVAQVELHRRQQPVA